MVLLSILASTFIISLLAFSGLLTLARKGELKDETLLGLVGFSAGALIGGAFLHLIPETVSRNSDLSVFLVLTSSFVLFFIFERFIWRHCHKAKCEVHPFVYMNLLGDMLHNFIDGLVISASFLAGIELGIVTSIAVALHEIPQEIGDFGVLVYGGMAVKKALILNFAAALTAILGGLAGFGLSSAMKDSITFLLPFTAGGFIYIAASDLIPELHKATEVRSTVISFTSLLLGIVLMLLIKIAFSS
ncbi:ZIP family metal transporter [Candidatus Bathyarchaeota archaeon]|nr:ZIP family metal transporter [Candidatus Bathyarchaeota archaeon]